MAGKNLTLRSLFIIPEGAVDPRMGGGQRSAIQFAALKQLGPVDVVILGSRQSSDTEIRDNSANKGHVFFPDADSVRMLHCWQYSSAMLRGARKFRHNIKRFGWIEGYFSPDHQVVSGLEHILRPDHRLVVFRYALTQAVTGITRQPGRDVIVDIDDRDDQTIASRIHVKFGDGLSGRVAVAALVPRLRRVLRKRLRDTSLLWYATPEDHLDLPGVPDSTLPNVPYAEPDISTIPAPSANRDISFIGSFGHRPNQDGMRWFLRHCWPSLHRLQPETRLRIAGLGDWASFRAEFPELGGIDYVGQVTDVAEEYRQARLSISPLLEGGGSKIKVIEACSYARPLVVTPHSLRGFGADLANLVPSAAEPGKFTEICVRLLQDGPEADRLGRMLHGIQQRYFFRREAEAIVTRDIHTVLSKQ